MKRLYLSLNPKSRLLLWATLLSTLCGAIEFGEPLEDALRGARNYARQHSSDGQIVVVGNDDKTAEKYNGFNYSRTIDARLVDNLFALGARRVFFDRAYADASTNEGDAAFAKTLARYRGRVFLGAMTPTDRRTGKLSSTVPIASLRSASEIAMLTGLSTPFRLSAELTYGDILDGQYVKSISSQLANINVQSTELYRPDWSIDARSIPTLSLYDVAEGYADRASIEGKDVVVGPVAASLGDTKSLLSQGWVPGVYFQVIGAETLKRGVPSNIGWLPAFVFGMILSVFLLTKNKRNIAISTSILAVLGMGALPLAFDQSLIKLDVVPAALLFAVVSVRALILRRIDKTNNTNAITNLPSLQHLKLDHFDNRALIALRILNLAEIEARLDSDAQKKVMLQMTRRISVSNPRLAIYHDGNTLYWQEEIRNTIELKQHLEGLYRLLISPVRLKENDIDMRISMGVDESYNLDISSRISRAILGANAAEKSNEITIFKQSSVTGDDGWELSIANEVDKALDKGEISVNYQPKYCLATNEIIGAEALVRWTHPVRGIIAPTEFIDALEKQNKIERLTLFVLEEAIGVTADIIHKNIPFEIGVNLSATLLDKKGLLTNINRIIAKYELSPKNLILEVTETAEMQKRERSIALLRRLAEQGIGISIDDYGSGNANLNYLKIMPVSEIKIDRRFVGTMTVDKKDHAMVKSTIALAHTLGCKVVAEGVENQQTLVSLREAGCDYVQGYLMAPALRLEDLHSKLLIHNSKKVA